MPIGWRTSNLIVIWEQWDEIYGRIWQMGELVTQMDRVAFYGGIVLIVVGLAAWLLRPNSPGEQNAIKFLGFEFTLNTPALAVMVIGIVMMVLSPSFPEPLYTSPTIPFKCSLRPSFVCHYAVYRSNGKVQHFSVAAGNTEAISGISSDDRYCVSTVDPPDNPDMCTTSNPNLLESSDPWRLKTRRVGGGESFN